MARPSSIDAALPRIVAALDAEPRRVHLRQDLFALFEAHRDAWRLAESIAPGRLLRALLQKTALKPVELESSYGSSSTRYLWGRPSAFAVGLSLRSRAYLSHATAAFLHELTDEVPKVIHVNVEQSAKPRPTGGLTQERIDRAFRTKQRESKLSFAYDIYRLLILNGMHSDDLEVGILERPAPDNFIERLRVTKLERTLIDLTVRSTYAGGVPQVLEAYRRAKPRLSIAVLLATLKKLDYVYPWHQAVGFYLQRAGFEPSRLARFKELGLGVDFYLAYGLKTPHYDSDWRIHYPEGL